MGERSSRRSKWDLFRYGEEIDRAFYAKPIGEYRGYDSSFQGIQGFVYPKGSFSVTNLESYRSCPYRYYLNMVLPKQWRDYRPSFVGTMVHKVLENVESVYAESTRRVPTGMLNDVLNEAVSMAEPPTQNGRRLKLFYATQVAIQPPTFVVFVNESTLVHFSYERYLENYFRKTFGFSGTPIKILFRNRTREE